jgi:hypothetical protein
VAASRTLTKTKAPVVRAPGASEDMVRVRVATDGTAQGLTNTSAELRKRGFEPTLVTP